MELADYIVALRKRWVLIVAAIVIGALGGFIYAQTITPQYRATASVFVSLERGDTVSDLYQGANYTQSLVTSYSSLATMPAVLEPVIADLDLKTSPYELSERVTTMVQLDTAIIDITSVEEDPQRAADVANAVAQQLAETVDEVSPSDQNGDSTVQVTVVASAQAPEQAFTPNTKLLISAGIGAGLFLGILIAVGLSILDTRIRTAKDLPNRADLAVLGSVPWARSENDKDKHLLGEAYRRVRTNLQFLDIGAPIRSFVVTSSVASEGKTTTAISLAYTLAEHGQRVLLVDADLRRPTLADRLGLEGAAGLTTVLQGQAKLEDVIQQYRTQRGPSPLSVLTSGIAPPNPGHYVESAAMDQLMDVVTKEYDVVIFDVPPLLPVTDGAFLARRTQGAVVVARAKHVRHAQLNDALDSLDAIGATCLGLIANGVSRTDHDFDEYVSAEHQ